MKINQRSLVTSSVLLLTSAFSYLPVAYAAKQVDLNNQGPAILRSLATNMVQTGLSTDFKNTVHVRMQQTYLGYPVWGAEGVVHIPNGDKNLKTVNALLGSVNNKNVSSDGTIYLDLDKDLVNTPAYIFTKQQADKSLLQAIKLYQEKTGVKADFKDQKSELIVFVDDKNVAHWAHKISFYYDPAREGVMPAKPVYIMDAVTLKVYEQWDEVKTITENEATVGGGFGGNKKMGKLIYDGLKENLASLKILRDPATKICSLQNADVTVKHKRGNNIPTFNCENADEQHNNVFWDAELDAVNGGYSPDNDALFGGAVIKDMYLNWYKVPVLIENGKPMMLVMVVHDPIDNAYWDGRKMTFGDGVRMFYPLTSLGVAAHEISHGFTEQHSNLTYYGQSGGMNESFSDMAAQAAEVFAYNKNSWQIGPEIFKAENEALRYMDQPSKDCKNGRKPGQWCSIDDASQYHSGIDVHYSSGVYNRFFYLLGTTKNWDVKKAFDVMVQANSHYWTSSTNFTTGACGVLKATKDLGYEVEDVVNAFKTVKIDTSTC